MGKTEEGFSSLFCALINACILKHLFKRAADLLLQDLAGVIIGELILVCKSVYPSGMLCGSLIECDILTFGKMHCQNVHFLAQASSQYEIKDIKVRSMVFIEVVPKDEREAKEWYADLEVGDVLTFRYVYAKQETITHRITDIYPNENGGYTITLEGDNKNADSNVLTQTIDTSLKNSPNYVIGKVTGQSYLFGLFISVLKSPAGIISIIILPSFVMLLMEVLKIVRMMNADKHKKHEEEKAQQLNELDELRRRLAELEAEKTASPPAPESTAETPVTETDTTDADATLI